MSQYRPIQPTREKGVKSSKPRMSRSIPNTAPFGRHKGARWHIMTTESFQRLLPPKDRWWVTACGYFLRGEKIELTHRDIPFEDGCKWCFEGLPLGRFCQRSLAPTSCPEAAEWRARRVEKDWLR